MSSRDEEIIKYTNKIINDYELIRGKSKQVFPYSFWDLVVISSSDNVQKNAFEIQINLKIERGELPLDVPYHVISDPQDTKIGSGGSTILGLEKLLMMYGEKLFTFKILLIHAGGQSQRMPCHSVLGKLFVPLPFGKPMFHMLDLLLALYWPFTKKMNAGVFLVSSDAFITYYLTDDDDEDSWSFQNSDFTALAHPSTLEIGTKHGVYVLPSLSPHLLEKPCFTTSCLEVLQKPSVEMMRNKEAIVSSNENGDNELSVETVYSDSVFFFNSNIMRKFIDYIQSGHNKINCELDAYGDFLQGLGSKATSGYIYDTNNVFEVSDSLTETRENIYHLLNNSTLNVIVLQKSKFYHLGTIREYIDNMCNNKILAEELGLKKWVFSLQTVSSLSSSCQQGTIMHSRVHPSSVINPTAIIEYCNLHVATKIGHDCIISGCSALGEKIDEVPIEIPSSCLLHTIAIKFDNINGYVTIAFGTDDDLKQKYSFAHITKMKYFGKCLEDIQPVIFGCKKYSDLFSDKSKKCSLWQAKLFQVQLTMEDSFKVTINMIKCIFDQNRDVNLGFGIFPHLSMEDIQQYKDAAKMVEYRNELWQKIVECKTEDVI